MKKSRFTKLGSLFLGLSMALGVGAAISAKKVSEVEAAGTYTWNPEATPDSGWKSTTLSLTLSGMSWSGTREQTSCTKQSDSDGSHNVYQLGAKGSADNIFLCGTLPSSYGNAIKSVNIRAASYDASATCTIKVGSNSSDVETIYTGTTSKWTTVSNCYGEISSPIAGNNYVEIYLTGSTRATYIGQITIVGYDASSEKFVDSISLSGDLSQKSYSTVDSWNNSGLDAAVTMSDSSEFEGSISWGYNPESPAEFYLNESTSLNVSVSAGGKTDSKSINGINVSVATVSEGLIATPSTGSLENVIVKGKISYIDSIDTGSYGNATYFISDDGTRNNELQVYRGYSLNNLHFSTEDEIQVGDIVTVHGDLLTFSGTKEFNSGSYIVDLERTTPYVFVGSTLTGYVGQNQSLEFSYGNLSGELSIVSNNLDVLTVGTLTLNDGDGTVNLSFISAGTADLSFICASTTLANCTVTSNAITVSLNENSLSLKKGESFTLVATCNYGSVIWSGSTSSITVADGVVSISSNANVGDTTDIIATSTINSNVSSTCSITVIDGPAYATSFEALEGFTASTTYNTTVTDGPTEAKWKFYNGTVSTDSAISDTQSAQLRKYSATTGNPYAEMQFDINEGHSISFNAKCGTATGFGVEVFYSTDSGASYTSLLTKSIGNSSTPVVAEIASYVSKVRFKIEFTGSNPSSSNRKMTIDDVEIYTMAASTDPSIVITSKDGSGMMQGILGDIQEVTYETAFADGLSINWILVDSSEIVEWESPYVSFEKIGDDATLTVQLKNNDIVVASDSITLHTLVPTVMIMVDGTDRANFSMFDDETITITATTTNKPDTVEAILVSDDTEMEYSLFDDSDGKLYSISAGIVTITATITYNGNVVASDSLKITITAAGEKTLVVSTGTGRTSFKYGEALDTTGWTATYDDGKGNTSNIITSLDFGSMDFIGTRELKATYDGVESNGVSITVTNNGASADGSTINENLETSTTSSNLGANSEKKFDLTSSVSGVTAVSISLTAQVTGTNGTSYSHGVTFKLYDSNGTLVATSDEITVSTTPNGSVTWSTNFALDSAIEVAKASYTLTTKQSGSNLRQRSFDITVTNSDNEFASKQALAWARFFNEQIGDLCDISGETSNENISKIKDKWSTLANEYGWMVGDSKDYFVSNLNNETISRAFGMYEQIVKKYSQENFIVDSLNNTVTNANKVFSLGGNFGGHSTWIVAVVAIAGLTAIGGCFFYRKRKQY